MMCNFLTDRYKRVNINGFFSTWYKIKRGVLQGIVVGLLLFNLNCSLQDNTNLIQHADDCVIFSANYQSNVAKNNLQISIDKIIQYFQSHELNVNAAKTEYICFSKNNDPRNDPSDQIKVGQTLIGKNLNVNI